MELVQLKKVAQIDRMVATDEECETLPYVGLEHIEKGTGQFSGGFVQRPEDMRATKFRFTPQHVLYGKLRPYLNKAAMPYFDGVCTTEILPILPDEGVLSRTFLWGILLSPQFVDWATRSVAGAQLPRLSPSDLADYCIPLPPFDEQRRIAAILEEADRARRTRRFTQSLSDSFLQEVFVEMFGDPEKRWQRVSVEAISLNMRTGPFGSQLLHSEFVDKGIAVLGIDNAVQNRFVWDERRFITPKKYEQLKRYTVYPGDVIITIMGTTGRCAIVPDDIPLAINTKHLCCITLDQEFCLPIFLKAAFLYHPEILDQLGISQRGAIMDGLNMGIIKDLRIPLPPLSLQEEFAAFAAEDERVLDQQIESEQQAEHLFQTLLHRAFRGEL